MTLMVDSGLILLGEIRRQSLLRVETQERTRLIVGNYLDQVSMVNNGFMTSVKIPINLFFLLSGNKDVEQRVWWDCDEERYQGRWTI